MKKTKKMHSSEQNPGDREIAAQDSPVGLSQHISVGFPLKKQLRVEVKPTTLLLTSSQFRSQLWTNRHIPPVFSSA